MKLTARFVRKFAEIKISRVDATHDARAEFMRNLDIMLSNLFDFLVRSRETGETAVEFAYRIMRYTCTLMQFNTDITAIYALVHPTHAKASAALY